MRGLARRMTMSPLYPCGKPCSRGTHNETVKNLALFSSIINGIMKESWLRISVPWECFQFFNRIENSITFTPYPWVVGKAEILIRLIIVVNKKNCQAYLVCSLFFHPLRCPVDLASSSSWLAQQVAWPK